MINVKMEAAAFRIWAHCAPRGWGDTAEDVATALDLPISTVRAACRHKGWNKRLPDKRVNGGMFKNGPDMRLITDAALGYEPFRRILPIQIDTIGA